MKRLFGGQVLLRWELPKPPIEGQYGHLPVWVRLPVSFVIFWAIATISILFILITTLFRDSEFQGLSIDLFEFGFLVSLGFGFFITIFVFVIALLPKVLKDEVVFRERWIESRYLGQSSKFKFKRFDCYAFGESEGRLDGKKIRILALVNEQNQSGIAIELPPEISDEMVNKALKNRLKQNDLYGGVFADERT